MPLTIVAARWNRHDFGRIGPVRFCCLVGPSSAVVRLVEPQWRVEVSLLVHSDAVNLAFLVTSLVVVATPGTGALLTISAGLSRGWRASLVTAVGCTLGIVPHLVAAVTGTAVLLRASGVAFEVVKVAGWSTWRGWRWRPGGTTAPCPRSPSRSAHQAGSWGPLSSRTC